MGCCFAKPTRHPHPQTGGPTLHHHHHNLHRNTPTNQPSRATVDDRAPPPSLEEEYVKEVLSETPLPKPHPEPTSAAAADDGETQKFDHKQQIEKLEVERVVEEVSQSMVSEMCSLSEVSQSQVSEMCSVSESYSTATTFTEKRDDEVVSKPSGELTKRTTRSPSKVPRKRPFSGEISTGRERVPKSPARRAQPSPETKPPAAERKSRGAAQSRTWQQNVGSNGVRRDPGEASGRRSRSPVTRAGRGSTGRSPMKKPGKPISRPEKREAEEAEAEVESQSKEEEEPQNGVAPPQGNESIENPHVSLECFIFL